MLPFLLLSAVTIAGASLVFLDSTDDPDDSDDNGSPPDHDPNTQPMMDVSEWVNLSPPAMPSETDITDPDARVTGTDQADIITVDTGTSGAEGQAEFLSGSVQYFPDDANSAVTQIDAGAGDDTILVRNGIADITTGDGADTVDATGLEGGVIRAGSGDLIIGSNVGADPNAFYSSPSVGAELQDDVTYQGGTADEYVAAFGDGATVDGGAGDDVILNFDGSATLRGGAGDDVIDAHAFGAEYDQNTRLTPQTGDGHADLVDGGEGNDRIFVDGGDTVSGGTGYDTIYGAFDLDTQADPLSILDYNGAEDSVILSVSNYAAAQTDAGTMDFDPSGRVSVMEGDGDSHVFVDDTLIAVLEGVSGVTANATYVPQTPDDAWHGLRIELAPI